MRWRGGQWVLAGMVAFGGCECLPGLDLGHDDLGDDVSDDDWADDHGYCPEDDDWGDDDEPPVDPPSRPSCYDGDRVCHEASQDELDRLFESLFLETDEYRGLDRDAAEAMVSEYLEHGRLLRPGVSTAGLHAVEPGLWRAHLFVTSSEGLPQIDLEPADFRITAGGQSLAIRDARPWDSAEDQLSVAFVLDDSGVVTGCDVASMAAGVTQFVTRFGESVTATALKFGQAAQLVSVDEIADKCTRRGPSALWDATLVGLGRVPPSTGARAVVVVAGTSDAASRTDLDTVLDAAHVAGTPIFVVGSRYIDLVALPELAIATGGRFHYAPTGETIDGALRWVGNHFDRSYVVEFEDDSETTQVRIEAELPDGVVVAAELELP